MGRMMTSSMRDAWWVGLRKELLALLFGVFLLGGWSSVAKAEDAADVLRGFTEQQIAAQKAGRVSDERKHQVMFIMGFLLLIGVITTASLGVAMVLFGKKVFVAHMVSAGFSVFLSIAHAVTAIVWFFPF